MPMIHDIALDHILPDPENPRSGEPEGIEALAANIGAVGLLNPINVREIGPIAPPDGHDYDVPGYMIVAGHRRYEAAKQLGWKTIPCTIIKVEEDGDSEEWLGDSDPDSEEWVGDGDTDSQLIGELEEDTDLGVLRTVMDAQAQYADPPAGEGEVSPGDTGEDHAHCADVSRPEDEPHSDLGSDRTERLSDPKASARGRYKDPIAGRKHTPSRLRHQPRKKGKANRAHANA